MNFLRSIISIFSSGKQDRVDLQEVQEKLSEIRKRYDLPHTKNEGRGIGRKPDLWGPENARGNLMGEKSTGHDLRLVTAQAATLGDMFSYQIRDLKTYAADHRLKNHTPIAPTEIGLDKRRGFHDNPSSRTELGNEINPATGLPMIGAIDVNGNPFGLNNSSFSREF